MTLAHARQLRRSMTEAEKRLWRHLRDHRLQGHKFRRQQPIDRYIADFVCFEQKLIIEADGGQHANQLPDTARTAFFESHGFRVLRFWNNQILDNTEGVLNAILSACRHENA